MITQTKNKLIEMLLPEDIERFNPETMTKDDMLIALGWNMYRDKLLEKLNIK